MTTQQKQKILLRVISELKAEGIISTQKEFAEKLGRDNSNISSACHGKEPYLTNGLFKRILNCFPEVNPAFIKEGLGSVLLLGRSFSQTSSEDINSQSIHTNIGNEDSHIEPLSPAKRKEMLLELMSYSGARSYAAFGRMFGMSEQRIHSWFTRGSFNSELIKSKFPEISGDWLLTGNGPMLKACPTEQLDYLASIQNLLSRYQQDEFASYSFENRELVLERLRQGGPSSA